MEQYEYGQEIFSNENYTVVTGEVEVGLGTHVLSRDGYHVINRITGYVEDRFTIMSTAIHYANVYNEALEHLDDESATVGEHGAH